MGPKTKIFVLSLTLAFIGVVIADTVFAARYREKINQGADGFLCEAFRLADNAVNGFVDTDAGGNTLHRFIGIENVASKVHAVDQMVQPASPTIQTLLAVLDETSPIKFAVNEFLAYLEHMNDVLSDSTNVAVGPYTCVFCSTCCSAGSGGTSQLGSTIASVRDSVASALVSVRQTVADSLTGDGLAGVRDSLSSASNSVDSFKTSFEDQLGSALVDHRGLFESIVQYIGIATIVIICLMALPTLLLLLVVGVGALRHESKHRPRHPCFASSSWCLTFLFAFILFLIAGILGLVAYLESSVCEILADPDSLIANGYFRTGSDNGQTKDILSTCFTRAGTGDLLGTIALGNGKTARDSLSISAMINDQFDRLQSATSGNAQFSENSAVVDLLDAMRDFGSLYTIMPNKLDEIRNDPQNQIPGPMAASLGQSTLAALLRVSLGGVPDCTDRTAVPLAGPAGDMLKQALVAAGVTIANGQTSVDLTGAASLYTALTDAGIDIGIRGSSCPADFVSLPTPSSGHPFDAFMEMKTDVVTHTFRCDGITVAALDGGEAGVTAVPRTCTFTEWIAFVSDLQVTLRAKAAAIDGIQQATMDKINTDLRQTVQDTILPVIDDLVDGLDCKFLFTRLVGAYTSLCWHQAPGLIGSVVTWLIYAVLCWLCILVEFVIWRHLRDNRSIWKDMHRPDSSRDSSSEGSVQIHHGGRSPVRSEGRQHNESGERLNVVAVVMGKEGAILQLQNTH